jgi:signal transduction histidine kinase
VSAFEATELAGIAAGVTLVGLVLGLLLLRVLRGRSIAAHIVAITCTTVVAITVGAALASRAMFISAHDLKALVVVLVAAGVVAIAVGLLVGARIGGASRALVAATRSIGEAVDAPSRIDDRAPAELRELAEELTLARRRLFEAAEQQRTLEASRRELVAWVSHDLRTPLAGMRAIVEALEDRVVDDPLTVDRYLATLRVEVDQLANLVDDLFELSRTQAGALVLHFERISLEDLVSDVIASAMPVARAKGVRLEARLVGPPAELVVSTPEVQRALRNLLENAIRHSPDQGRVVVEAGVDRNDPAQVCVSVHDTGGGIPEPDLEHVFEAGFARERARTNGGGAGIGLAIAKGFVEAHRGDIAVCNEDGGAKFTMRLPLERA